MEKRKAVLLLSGGLDSTTLLALATSEGYAIHALSFDYGQRHSLELSAAIISLRAFSAACARAASAAVTALGAAGARGGPGFARLGLCVGLAGGGVCPL